MKTNSNVCCSVALAGDEDDNGDLQEYCVCGNNFDPESPIFMTIFNATIDSCTGLLWTLGWYDDMPHVRMEYITCMYLHTSHAVHFRFCNNAPKEYFRLQY